MNFNRAAQWIKRLLGRGANSDVRPELLPDGLYRDALNMRPSSVSGDTGSLESIGGEELVYAAPDPLPPGYVCIGSASVNERLVEFWASSEEDEYPIVRVNGVIVAQSENIPYTYDRPLQMAVVERCGGAGVVYPADHQSPPLFWDIQAMLDALAAGDGTYFGGFNIEINSVFLSAYPEFPRHRGNPILDGSGLPTGQYQYSLRYEAPTGDKTNFGPETPLITLPRIQDVNWNSPMPGARQTGGPPDTTTGTSNGIEIEFNVDNTQGFSFVEIGRRRFNDGQGLNGPGTLEIIARLEVVAGEFRNIRFVDPVDANFLELVVPEEEEQQQIDIEAPKGVEYADNRLTYANFTLADRVPDLDFQEVDGLTFVPITKEVVTLQDGVKKNSGYTDPVNMTYLKSFTRGERFGIGIQPWDSALSKPYAVPVPGLEDYQFVNRRDVKSGNSLIYSDSPTYAANVNTQGTEPVTPTFDAFTQGTTKKTDAGLNASQINVSVNSGVGYFPWTPTSPTDPSVSAYNVPPTVGRVLSHLNVGAYPADSGNIFSPTYNALGLLLWGPTRESIPSWMKAFTFVRTAPAGRVVCQGLGTYVLSQEESFEAGVTPTGKKVQSLEFFSRDLQLGLVPQNIVEDIRQNPQNYELQFVSPLGFYSEIYGYYHELDAFAGRFTALGTDMLSYASIQHDEAGPFGVNIGEPGPGGMAYQPGPSSTATPGNYVGYGAWRNPAPPAGQTPGSPDPDTYSYWSQIQAGVTLDGNTPVPFDGFSPVTSGRSNYWRIDCAQIYTLNGRNTGGDNSTNKNFQSDDVRRFHEPWYVINIIRKGAEVPDLNTQEYVNTGTTIKMEGCIGVSTGATTQQYRLVNERREDVYPYFTTDNRYVYVSEAGQPIRAWICISNNSVLAPATILAAIAADGFWVNPADGKEVYGIYEVVIADTETFIEFGLWGGTPVAAPASGARIIVRYDDTAPIRVFGGDCTIAPSTHAIFDNTWLFDNGNPDPTRLLGLPLPYPGFVKNPNYVLPVTATTQQTDPAAYVNDMETLRQWCVMFDVESRTNPLMDLFASPAEQSAPRGHYVIMPFAAGGSLIDGFQQAWFSDYPGWDAAVGLGGIRFSTYAVGLAAESVNRDYWKQPLVQYLGLPQTGFDERTDYCNGLITSLERDPLQNNAPGNRTFLSANLKVISEENGEIKAIASLLGSAGQNMYAVCQSGVCRILTNKNILTGASGEQISTQSISNYWGDEMWLTRNIGSPDQMWRLLTKGYSPAGQGYADSLFWADRNGFYRLTGDSIANISKDKYFSVLRPSLVNFPSNYTPQTTSFYNTKYNEVCFSIGEQTVFANPPLIPSPFTLPQRMFVYSAENNEWIGQYSYTFDSYAMVGQQAYGMRDLESYALDEGDTINSEIRRCSVITPMVGEPGRLKEAFRWRVVGDKPDEIRLYNKDGLLWTIQNEALAEAQAPGLGSEWALRYDSYEGYIWAINQAGEYFDLLPEDEFFFLESIWYSSGQKEVLSLHNQLRNIK